ncbi:glycoside hydrolase family 16 protein [Christiangramia aquimixticola]|uniref:glycoside hydrolase family 16 protein n=1 Tax=Christiangramia aquimixticola TaxID=1697558 RepID=UPI003AA85A12
MQKNRFRILQFFFLLLSYSMISQNYELLWHDEFNTEGKPNPEFWNYETGFIRNLEKQIYTKRKRNVRVKDGKLEITARRETYYNKKFNSVIKNYRYNTQFANYTSGSIHTRGKIEITYGRIDISAKLPEGKGLWPAIWMLGANFKEVAYPNAGEIDIMEHVGKDSLIIHGTVHYPWDNNTGYKSSTASTSLENPSKQYHLYSAVWTPEKIDFLVDGKVYHSFKISEAKPENNPFHKPFYLIINLAVGGNWPGEIEKDIFPQKLFIDYVRVYKLKK